MIARVPERWHTVCDLCTDRLDSHVFARQSVERFSVAVHGYGPHICRSCRWSQMSLWHPADDKTRTTALPLRNP